MAKKTALTELRDSIKSKIPGAGTSEELLVKQREFSWIVYEIGKDMLPKEKEQLRDAFNKGVMCGTMLALKNDKDGTHEAFEYYYKEKYEHEA